MNETSTESGEDNVVALLELRLNIPQSKRNCCCTGVTITLNVNNNLIQWNTSTLGNSLDNSKVSLMWYNPLYIICCEIILLQYFQYIVTHISNGIAEYCSTLLIEVV